MTKKPYPFGVIDGDGKRKLGETFERPAGTAPLDLLLKPPCQNNVLEKDKLKSLTSNPLMKRIIEAYFEAQEKNYEALAVIWDNEEEKNHIISANDSFTLIDMISMTSMAEAICGHHDDARYRLLFFFDDTALPFKEYISENKIKTISLPDDIQKIFWDNDYDLEKTLTPSQYQKSPRIYSEKIEHVRALFEEEKKKGGFKCLYIRLKQDGNISPLMMSIDYNRIEDVNNFLMQVHPHDRIIMGLNLHEDFDKQIGSGDFDPEQLISWDSLKERPLDCITPMRLIENQIKKTPVTLGPKGPVLAWNNKDQPKP